MSVKAPARLKATVQAWASSAPGERLTKVELIRNGEVVKTFTPESEKPEFRAAFDITEADTAWYIARCFGAGDGQVAITNPIYFESASYRAPRPAPARVSGTVVDDLTGKPLDGTCDVVRMVGRTPVKESEVAVRNGRFTATVPATARLRIRANGYAPVMKSILLDYKPLFEFIANQRAEQLSDWATFEKVKALLGDVRLEFRAITSR